MTDGEIRRAVAEKIMGYTVALRWCQRDLECGGWDEVESFEGPDGDGQGREWYAQQFCYQKRAADGDIPARWDVVPYYPSDIAAAFAVAEKMRTDGWHYEMGMPLDDLLHYARFMRGAYDLDDDSWSENALIIALSLPRAICLAALKAIEERADAD